MRRARSLLPGFVLATTIPAACGASGGSDATGPPRSTTTTAPEQTTTTTEAVDHQTSLAEGETAGIASQLVEVPGYRYEDVSAEEVEGLLDIMRRDLAPLGDDPIRAASFHSVVADDDSLNTADGSTGPELGFFRLLEFRSSPPADLAAEVARLGTSGLDEIDQLEVDGTEVVVFEDPESIDSRYTLTWLRHGVQGVIDGATRAPLERWVQEYLAIPEREPTEDDRLAAALRSVPGYAYVNYWDDVLIDAVRPLLDGHPASIHTVTDDTGAMAVLALAETGEPLDQQGLVALADDLDPSGSASATQVAGVPVATTTTADATLWVWSEGEISGVLVAPDESAGAAFLEAYLGAD